MAGAPAALRTMPIVVGCASAPAGTITSTPSGPLTVPPCGPIRALADDGAAAGSTASSPPQATSADTMPARQTTRIISFDMLHLHCGRTGRSEGVVDSTAL